MKNWTHPSWCLSIFLLSHLNNINSFALNLMEPSIDGKIRKWRRTFSLKMGEQPKDFVIFLTNHHSIFFWNLPEFSRKTVRFLVAYWVEYSIIEYSIDSSIRYNTKLLMLLMWLNRNILMSCYNALSLSRIVTNSVWLLFLRKQIFTTSGWIGMLIHWSF